MPQFFHQLLYCLLTDGAMTYPIFVEVSKGRAEVDLDYLKRQVSEQYRVPVESLEVVSHPRWATRRTTTDGHVVHLGMLPP